MRISLFAASLALALCCCASAASAAMTRQDIVVMHEQSLESLRKGDSAKAYAGYLRLLREDPGNPDIDFMMGQAAFAEGNYPMSLLAYIRVLKANPAHERARLELARVYGRMGQTELARSELAALRAINPALSQIDEMEKSILGIPPSPWAFRGTVGAGVFYDSNANTSTATSTYMGDTLPSQNRKKDSFGAYMSGGLDLAYRLGQETNWHLVGDVSATNREYFNPDLAKNSRRLTWGRAGLGLRWASEKLLAEARGKGEFLGDGTGYVTQSIGAEGAFAYALTEDWTLITQGSWEHRDYVEDYKEMRGTYGKAGQYVRWQFGEARHEVLVGGSYFFENARKNYYTGRGVELLGRVQFNLPWEVKTGFLFSWRGAYYDAPPPAPDPGVGKRREDQYTFGVELEKGITKHLSVNTQVQYTDKHANHSLYRYDQWLFALGLTYTF